MEAKTPKMPAGMKKLPLNKSLLHEVVVALRANARQNTAHAKDRSEKSGGGKKPWRQKGTGRARHGSSRSPIWRGGGVTFGPRPERNLKKDVPNKKKRLAVDQIIAQKIREGRLMVTQEVKLTEPKTRYADSFLTENLPEGFRGRVLLVLEEKNEDIFRSFRNIPYVTLRAGLNFNAYDLLYNAFIVFTEKSWKEFLAKRGFK